MTPPDNRILYIVSQPLDSLFYILLDFMLYRDHCNIAMSNDWTRDWGESSGKPLVAHRKYSLLREQTKSVPVLVELIISQSILYCYETFDLSLLGNTQIRCL